MSKARARALTILQDLKDLVTFTLSVLYLYMKAFYRFFIPPPPKSLHGKVVLVTGSAGGIGRQICIRLAHTGAVLVCWDINKKINDEFVKDLVSETGARAYSYQVNIADRSHVQSMLEQIRTEVGEINIVINNAAVMPCKPFLQQTPDELELQFQVNVLSHFWILQEVLPRMIERNDGHIVTTCSAAGLIGTRNLAAYSGTKHAIHGFIEALKDEVRFDKRRTDNVHFTTVYPFSCNTGLLSGVKSHSRFPFLIKNVLQPEEVAEKLVDGLRRNYEHVYVPGFISFAGTTAKLLIPEVQRAANDFLNCHVEPVASFPNKVK